MRAIFSRLILFALFVVLVAGCFGPKPDPVRYSPAQSTPRQGPAVVTSTPSVPRMQLYCPDCAGAGQSEAVLWTNTNADAVACRMRWGREVRQVALSGLWMQVDGDCRGWISARLVRPLPEPPTITPTRTITPTPTETPIPTEAATPRSFLDSFRTPRGVGK